MLRNTNAMTSYNDGPEFALPAAAGGQATGYHCALSTSAPIQRRIERYRQRWSVSCQEGTRNCDVTRPSHEACPSQQVGSSPRISGDAGHVSCGSQTAAEGRPDVHAHILAEPRIAPDGLQRPLLPPASRRWLSRERSAPRGEKETAKQGGTTTPAPSTASTPADMQRKETAMRTVPSGASFFLLSGSASRPSPPTRSGQRASRDSGSWGWTRPCRPSDSRPSSTGCVPLATWTVRPSPLSIGGRRALRPPAGPAAELVGLPVDILVTAGPPAVRAAQQATTTIPIVAAAMHEPVTLGFVASLARPGGNITGQAFQQTECSTKRLELLKEAVPQLTRLAPLWEATGAAPAPYAR